MDRPIRGFDVVPAHQQAHVLVGDDAVAERLTCMFDRVIARVGTPLTIDAEFSARCQIWVPRPRVVPAEVSETRSMPGLRLVQLQSAGAEAVIGRTAPDVVVASARGARTPATAEWALGVILAAQRGLPSILDDQRRHLWRPQVHRTVYGATCLLVGAGSIARTLRDMLELFGVTTRMVSRTGSAGSSRPDQLMALLPTADLVVLALPATPQTIGLVDRPFLAAMKHGALLVNAARGSIIVTDALVDALHEGRVRAALDVTDPEPLPPDHPLWDAPGLILTPHLAGTTPDTAGRILDVVADQIDRVLRGDELVNVVGELY